MRLRNISPAKKVAAVVGMALALSAARSDAEFIINFDQFFVATGGSLFYDGEGGPLVGSGIQFDVVRLIDSDTDTVLAAVQCGLVGDPCMNLEFQTGLNTVESAGTDTYAWGSAPLGGDPLNNFFNVVVASDAFGGILGLPVGTLLLSGTVSSASFAPEGATFRANVSGLDVKNAVLLEALFDGIGIPPTEFRYLNSETIVNAADFDQEANGGFTAFPSNADIDNIPAVPEPGSSLLLLLGLGSLAAYLRRRS